METLTRLQALEAMIDDLRREVDFLRSRDGLQALLEDHFAPTGAPESIHAGEVIRAQQRHIERLRECCLEGR